MPVGISKELQEQMQNEFGWIGTLMQFEQFLVDIEASNDPATLDTVTMTIKYKDFKALVVGMRDFIVDHLPAKGRVM